MIEWAEGGKGGRPRWGQRKAIFRIQYGFIKASPSRAVCFSQAHLCLSGFSALLLSGSATDGCVTSSTGGATPVAD